jgi:hypothetical protein
MLERAKRVQNVVRLLWAASVVLIATPSSVFAQEQTTQQLPLPTGQTQTQTDDKRWTVTFDSDVRYFSTKITTPGLPTVGSNVTYVPMGFGIVGTPNDDWKLEFGIRGGQQHIVTFQGSNGFTSPLLGTANTSYSGWVDTTVSSTVTYLAISGMQPFISMNTNIPTGHSFVPGAVGANPSDPDITQIAGFGLGWNFGPTIGVNIPITPNLLYTVSVGYTQRNPFTRVGEDVAGVTKQIAALPGFGAIQTLFPGNDTTLTSSLGYQSGPWSLQVSAAITAETATMVDGQNFYQAGESYQFSGAAGYAWNEAWSSKITAAFAHINLNQNLTTEGPLHHDFSLFPEAFNTNNNVTNAAFDTTYKVGDLSLGPSATFMFRDHNGYDMRVQQFVAAKTIWMAGGVFEYALAKQFSINGRVQYIWGTIDSLILPPTPVMNINGWVYSIGAKAQF